MGFSEIYDLIDAHSFGGQRPNASAVFTFGHSGGIKPIINAFEIFRDDWNLTAEDWGTEQQEHKWKISDIATFASNMGIILYSCSEGAEQKVMLTHNEHIIDEQPACGETLCSVEDFKAYYQHIVDFGWDSECPMPEVPVDNNNNNTDVSGGSNNTVDININIDINHGNGDNSEDNGNGANSGDSSEDSSEDNSGEEDEDEDCDSSEDDWDEDNSSEEKDKKHKKDDKKHNKKHSKKCKSNKKCKKDKSSEEDSDEKYK